MLLDGKIDDDSDVSTSDTPSRGWAIGVGVFCLFPMYLLFSFLGNAGRGTAAMCFGGALIIVVRLRWELRNRPWFWVAVGVLTLLHLGLVMLVPWPKQDYTLPIVLPIGIVDILAISYLFRLIAKRMGPFRGAGGDSAKT